MKVSVRGKNDKLSKSEVRYAVNYYLSKLIPKKVQLREELEIEVRFLKLEDKGGCAPLDDWESKPQSFFIEIDSRMGKKEQLRTIAHECVHVKQFALGELKTYATHIIYKRKKYFLEDDESYWELPSEIEAFGREVGLYITYLDHLKAEGLRFLSPRDKARLTRP
jgi:hypothetical protein